MLMNRILPPMGRVFPEPARLFRDMERLFETVYGNVGRGPTSGVFPALNVTRDGDTFYVRAELPGMKADQLEVSVERNKLSTSGELRSAEPEGVSYHRRERKAGSFSRTVTLPAEIDAQRVEARFENGVLTISLPVAEIAKPRQIAVQAS